MAVKYFDKEKNEWVVFPGTVGAPGKDAYQMAVDNGFSGSKDDYINSLSVLPDVVNAVKSADSTPTKDSINLITSGAVYNALDNMEIPSLDEYAKKSDIPSVPTNISAFANDANYATTSDVDSAKNYTDEKIGDLNIPSLDGLATEQWVKDQKYLTTHQDISGLATKSEVNAVENKIPSLDNYYNKTEIDNKISESGKVDLTNYYTKSEADSSFITNEELTEELNEAMSGVLKYEGDGDISVDDFATKNDLDNYLTTELGATKDNVKFNKATSAGAPGYWDEAISGNSVTLSGYNELNAFGMIVTNINTNLTFIGNHAILSNIDDVEPTGNYKVYCIIYANGMHYINVAYYN